MSTYKELEIEKRSAVARDRLLTLVVPDAHTPYHDQDALDGVKEFAEDIHPDALVVLGDWFDMYAVSSFSKKPSRKVELQEDIDIGVDALEEFCHGLTTQRYFLAGNHEARWERYLREKAPELHGLDALEPEKLFALNDIGFDYFDYGDAIGIGNMWLTHGSRVSKHAGRTAQFNLESYGVPLMMGHSHRLASYRRSNLGGRLDGFECGHLTNGDPDYMDKPANFQQGLGLLWTDPRTGNYDVDLVAIKDGGFSYQGDHYSVD